MIIEELFDNAPNQEAEEHLNSFVESLEETDLCEDDIDSIYYLLSQVYEIAGFERPETLQSF